MKADGYVSDARYASCFAREKSSLQGWGPVKIRFQLRGKGISDDDISSGMAEIESSKADAKLRRLIEDKYKVLAGDPQCKLKLLKYVLSRGYEYDQVREIIEQL